MPIDAPTHAPAGFVVLRTPLLTWDEFLTWTEGVQAPIAYKVSLAELRRAIAEDETILRERLSVFLNMPAVREALFLASPALEENVDLWRVAPDSDRGLRVERGLLRYFARMVGRPTPFGLFAGCALGHVGEKTEMILGPRSTYQRRTRLDFSFLTDLCLACCQSAELREHLLVRRNSSLYRAGGRWHFLARLSMDERRYELVAVEEDESLQSLLSKNDAATISDLADALITDEISMEEARAYINELLEAQVVVPELFPILTGGSAIDELVAQLKTHSDTAAIVEVLTAALAGLERIDSHGIGCRVEKYKNLADSLSVPPMKVTLSRLFQVDLMPRAECLTVGGNVLDEIQRVISLLHRISAPRDELKVFRDRFLERYEQREMPLCEVLDEDIGIGASSLKQTAGTVDECERELRRQSVLTELLLRERISEGEIRLSEHDIARLTEPKIRPLPDSFSFFGALAANSNQAVADGAFQLLCKTIAGPPGAQILARFCHADPALAVEVEAYLRAEEVYQPQAAFAEVVHLPCAREGNVIARPIMREYEIPVLGRSGATSDRQISVDDLLVSVIGDRVVLRSARLDREIIPRCTSAQSFYRPDSMALFQFLCLLQHQGVAYGLSWRWGALANLPFLPRVVAGKTVLATKQWNLTKVERASLSGKDRASLFASVQELREKRSLPRFVAVAEADNFVPIDLDAVLSVDVFADMLKKRPQAHLIEAYPAVSELLAKGPEGRFAHELVVPYIRTNQAPMPPQAVPAAQGATKGTQRTFTPLSEWLYVKLYTGAAIADRVLAQLVAPVVRDAYECRAIEQWHFLRFADPQFHIRLRFGGDPVKLRRDVIPMLEERANILIASGEVHRVQYDTYVREVERYGGPEGITTAESIFHADSDAVLKILALHVGGGARERQLLAVRSVNELFNDFGFGDAEVLAMLRQRPRDAGVSALWSEEFRNNRSEVENTLGGAIRDDARISPMNRAIEERSLVMRSAIARYRALSESGSLGVEIERLALTFTHMHVNRLLSTVNDLPERKCYDFIRRFREATLARRT